MEDKDKETMKLIGTAVTEALKEGKVAVLSDITAIKDEFSKKMETMMAKPATPVDDKTAKLEASGVAGTVGQVSGFEVWGIPVGQAAVGGFIAVMATELVDGFMSTQSVQMRGAVKLVTAGALVKWGGKFIGSTTGKAVALLMAFDAIRDLTPIDSWAANLASKVTKKTPAAGLADKAARRNPAMDYANSVVKSYYGQALGR